MLTYNPQAAAEVVAEEYKKYARDQKYRARG